MQHLRMVRWVSTAVCVLSMSWLSATARAQVSVEVVTSSLRDGITPAMLRQRVGIANDGSIAIAASTLAGADRLLLATPGSAVTDLGLMARNGSDVAINNDSIVFISGAQVQALRRNFAGAIPNVLQDCTDPSTPCGSVRHVALSSDGYFAMTSFDSSGGIYRGRVQRGWLSTVLESVPSPPAFITALGIDVRVGGPMLILGDYSVPGAEVYGAFLDVPSRYGYFLYTAVSTRPRGGSEAPLGAVYGGYDTFALMPAQTDGAGVQLAPAAIVRGGSLVPYRTPQTRGTALLTLQSVAGGSLDVNELGLATAVATSSTGWSGLFSLDTNITNATPKQLVAIGQTFGRCIDTVIDMFVLGSNDAGQIAVLARMQGNRGVDTQVWRVTPTPAATSTSSHCTSLRRLPIVFP